MYLWKGRGLSEVVPTCAWEGEARGIRKFKVILSHGSGPCLTAQDHFPEEGRGALDLQTTSYLWSPDSFVFALFFSFSNLEMGFFLHCCDE